MVGSLKPYLFWLHLHPHWAAFAAGLIAFAESLAVVGLLIPGTVVMTAIGVLIGSSVLPFLSITLWAIVGAIAGDVVSYWIGYRYHEQIHQMWPFKRYPHLLDKGERFFNEHGGKGIFIGRFIGPMRPVLPLIAGMMSMRPLRFILVDTLSGILWAPAYLLPGILVGAASQELAPEATTRLLMLLVIALFLFWGVSWLLKRIYHLFESSIQHMVANVWTWVRCHPRLNRIDVFLRDPRRPENHGQFGLVLLFVLVVSCFLILMCSVARHGVLTDWNVPVNYFMRTLRTTSLDQIMVLITFLAEAPVAMAMWLGVLVWLLLKRNWWAAFHWGVLGGAVLTSTNVIKKLVHYPRPTGLYAVPSDYSFPSGHSTFATAFFGFLAVLLSYNRARVWQMLAAIISGLFIVAVLFSRLYLCVHWLTDVIGGFLLGSSWVCLLTISYRRRVSNPLAPIGILLVAIISLFIGWSGYFQGHYIKALNNYTPYWPRYTINAKLWWDQAAQQIPRYRTSRFGEPLQVINVQWTGTLDQIEQVLTKQGWHKQQRRTLVVFLSGLLSKDTSKQMPILSQLYEDRRPVLVMTKIADDSKTVVVLRLWDAHFKTDTGLSLWLGTVGFHKAWHNMLIPNAKDETEEAYLATPATQLLAKDLQGFDWKQIHYVQIPMGIQQTEINWDGYVLFIRPLKKAH